MSTDVYDKADDPAKQAAAQNDVGPFNLITSRGFEQWLAESKVTLAFSTYQYSRIFFVGLNKEERVSVSHVEVGHCLGFAFSGPNLWTSAETRMFCYRDILADTPPSDAGREALYVPRLCYFTGNLDIHDVAVTKQGGVIFANTRFKIGRAHV